MATVVVVAVTVAVTAAVAATTTCIDTVFFPSPPSPFYTDPND